MRLKSLLAWAALILLLAVPVLLAAGSPLLAWRQPIYIVAGFAGIAAMGLLLLQPLLAQGLLPGLSILRGRRVHRWTGAALVALVILHVIGLWIFSPPDVIDALLFRSPTPFAAWGVIAMWALFAAALLALFRRALRPRQWRLGHGSLVGIAVMGSVLHALQIDGTMEDLSKGLLCAAVLLATGLALSRIKLRPRPPR
jgi:predicted ferric reductase